MRLGAVSILVVVGLVAAGIASEKTELSGARRVYKDVREALEHGALTKRERRFDYCQPYEDASRSLYTSSLGVPRLYVHEAGSDDSAITASHYYDAHGRLRFVFITGGAVNGTHIEHRIWLSSGGTRIQEQQKLLEGPGYTFPNPWPDETLVKDPEQAFRSEHPCRPLSGDL
jgi:hypothetical protein